MSFYKDELKEKIPSASKELKLFLHTNLAEFPKANLIIVHGLAEFADRYEQAASHFVEHGYNVFRYDQLGHGNSDGLRGYMASSNDLSDNLNIVVSTVKKRFPNLSSFVLGHSMGGETVLLHATKFPNTVDGYIAIDPVSVYKYPTFANLPLNGSDTDRIPNQLSKGLNSDKRVVKKYVTDERTLSELTIGILNNAIWEGALYLRENINHITDPIFILHGLEDGIISVNDTLEIYPKISSKDKELHVYPFLQHEILNEPSRKKEILVEISSWIDKKIY